jgi:hypothetical protein
MTRSTTTARHSSHPHIHRAPTPASFLGSTSPHMRAIAATAVAMGVAAGAAVLMRKRTGSSLLIKLGLRRASLFSRIWPEIGVSAGALAVGAATLLVRKARRLEATLESQRTTLGDNKVPGFGPAASYESHAAGAELGQDRE